MTDPTLPSPTQHPTERVDLDLDAIRQRYAEFHRAILADGAMRDAWPAVQSADDVPALLADLDAAREELRRVGAERDEVARELGSEALRWRARAERAEAAIGRVRELRNLVVRQWGYAELEEHFDAALGTKEEDR